MTWNGKRGQGLGNAVSTERKRDLLMSNPSPSPMTRFGMRPGNPGGRTSSRWLRDMLNKASRVGDKTDREEIGSYLIRVAKGEDGAREAVEAAKVLLAYDMGQAPKGAGPIEVAEHLRQVEKDRVSTVIACLGSKLRTLSPVEMRDFFETCANDPEKFMVKAEQLLEGAPEAQAEQPAQLPEQDEAKP